MRRLIQAAGISLTALLAVSLVGAAELKVKPVTATPAVKAEEDGCGKYGTTVEFLDTPAEAAKQAKKEGKLVFVLHVSGDFEDPRFT